MQLALLAMRTVYIPGFRFVKKNRKRQRLNQEIQCSLCKLIEINGTKCEDSKNLLGLMLSANLLTWATLLLALHQKWQVKARDEVLKVCGKHEHPNVENLSDLKIVTMVLKETLRLYPPATFINRTATRKISSWVT